MMSCLVTRVLLNVSVALTVQCYQPDGSVYNRTICKMMPSNLAKLELLRDLFRQHNMSVPENLASGLGDKISNSTPGQDFGTTGELLEPVTIDFNSPINATRDLLGPQGDDEVHRDKENGEMAMSSSPVWGSNERDVNSNLAPNSFENKEAKTNLEIHQKELEDEITKNTTVSESQNPSESTKYLSLHDQIIISLERQMNMIEENVTALKEKETALDSERTKESLGEPWVLASHEHNLNRTENSDVAAFADNQTLQTRVQSLSDESVDEQTTPEEMTFNITLNAGTIRTENFSDQIEKREGEEEQVSDVSLKDKESHNFVRQDSLKVTTKLSEHTNRIEKRSIPNTNSGSRESQQRMTTKKFKENETSLEQSDGSEEHGNPAFPGPDNFWNVFVTSPVAVILNSTDKYGLLSTTDYEKAYYDDLVKKLKEKRAAHSQVEHALNDQAEQTKLYTEHSTGKTNFKSDELEDMLGQLTNSSEEKAVAQNMLEKMKQKPAPKDLKERLSPEKYHEYMELKKSLDEQYKDIMAHMNRTDREIKKLYMEMRNLREEKELHDYFEQNEDKFTKHSTPKNYTEEDILFLTTPDPTFKLVNQWEWENASKIIPPELELNPKHARDDEEDSDMKNYDELDRMNKFILNTDPESNSEDEELIKLFRTNDTNINKPELHATQRNKKPLDYESLEKYDKKKYKEIREMELKLHTLIPNMSRAHLDSVHAKIMSHLNRTRIGDRPRITMKTTTVTEKLWFEESVFDQNDPKILYAKYLHNIRNMTVRLNMEVGNKQIRNITSFNLEDRRYAHQYKSTTECRRFSHIIPFWLTQPKEIEEVFKGNTKIFREYIQYILDKHNYTELPVNGRFAFVRKYINKLNNPLIFNRITIFPTAYITTDHVLTLKEQFQQFKGSLKSKLHKAYKHMKHFIFNTSTDEIHDPVPFHTPQTEAIPDEVIINITTQPPMGPYYDYY